MEVNITRGATETSLSNAIAVAREARDTAEGYRDDSATSESNAGSSEDVALAQAGIATTKASEASTSASTATEQVGLASAKATDCQLLATNTSAQFQLSNGDYAYSTVHYMNLAEDARDAAEVFKNDASASESNASTSESNASTSESNASTSEANALTYSNNSSTSAGQSATSAGNAATSATNSESHANSAGVSATNAAASETNAGTSEGNAATSAAAAATSATNAAASAAIASGTAYGLGWNESTDVYTRTGDSAFTTIQSKMRRCLLAANGTVNAYLHSINSNYTESGSIADLTGANGNVMVEIPKFYYKYNYVGTTHSHSISLVPLSGYSVHPAFLKAGVEVENRYIGAYGASVSGSTLISASGVYPAVSMTRGSFRTKAATIGSGWALQDWNLISAVQLLMLVEFGTFNSQAAIGQGRTQLSGGAWSNGSYIGINGRSDTSGNATGNHEYSGDADDAAADLAFMSYRGIEDFFGNIWNWVDGINIQDNVPFINNNPSTFADDVFSGDYVNAGITMANANGWQNTLEQVGTGFFPASVGAGSSTKITDYYYQAAGNRVVTLGGYATNGSYAGAFDLNTNTSSGVSSAAIGSVLSF